MGQKTNPIGLRVAVNKDWRSKWYAEKKEFSKLLTEDRIIRTLLKKKLETASVPRILIERATNRCRVTILTARPGVVIGRKGSEIDKLKEELSKMTGKEVYVDIVEVKQPELDAQLVAENIALQLERRVSFRREMKKALQTAKDFGAEGIKIRAGGRLGELIEQPRPVDVVVRHAGPDPHQHLRQPGVGVDDEPHDIGAGCHAGPVPGGIIAVLRIANGR